ncbi:hypothetical protein GFY24_39570 [Nocardia sp. SYP-A9097]|uniref:hypothetical protein n=1 Tax=Nocardia sp. SYP-A9097 TaxID=2663237 RepID=UPI00129A3AA0|nr:hypothetical protein [Nocardia sp. SYP-A9097]MRH93440.1 hypothetical protein [Nocardia sp. SYP-A9097]
MSDLRQELDDAIAKLERQRIPVDREALKLINEHLAALALRLKDIRDTRDRYELGKLHSHANVLWKAAWHGALFPTALSTPERSSEPPSPQIRNQPELLDRPEPSPAT